MQDDKPSLPRQHVKSKYRKIETNWIYLTKNKYKDPFQKHKNYFWKNQTTRGNASTFDFAQSLPQDTLWYKKKRHKVFWKNNFCFRENMICRQAVVIAVLEAQIYDRFDRLTYKEK